MRVLVTGATGFIGFEVACQLAAAGLRPRLMVSRPERGALLRGLDAELVQGDLTSRASLARAVAGMDAVIHLGARATFEVYRLLRPTIVDGSVALAETALSAGVTRFVYASSVFVYGGQKAPVDRTTLPRPRNDYGLAKLEAERALDVLAAEHGLQLASVRLPHVYGARDLLFEEIRRGRVVVPGRGDNLFSHLHVEDAARVLIACAEVGWTGVSPVGDDRPATWREFFDVLRTYFPRVRVRRLPAGLARLGTELLRPLLWLRRNPSMLTPGAVIGWNLDLAVAPRLLWSELGIAPKYPTIWDGIPAVLDDAVAFRWLHPIRDHTAW